MMTVVSCPACQQNLQVPPDLIGKQVRCPSCQGTFTAGSDAIAAAAAVRSAVPSAVPSASDPSEEVPEVDVQPLSEPPPLPREDAATDVPVWEKPDASEEFAAPLQEAPDLGEEKRSKRKSSKGKAGGGYYDELMRNQRKRRDPHRGVLILMLGIFSILCSPLSLLALAAAACGYYAYQMAAQDLNNMKTGQMDPSGRGLTQAGMIMGIIGLVISFPAILLTLCLLIGALVRVAVGR